MMRMTKTYVKSVWAAVIATGLVSLGCSSSGVAQDKAQAVPAQCLNIDISPYTPPEKLAVAHADPSGAKVTTPFSVEIADNEDTREQGLMCRPQLAADQGMLFEFQNVAERSFWMQNTLIGLDIIYIAPDGRIVSIQKNAKPLDRTPLPSYGAASGVLEVQAGLSDKLGLKAGDIVIHPFFHKP
jgi:uncharacterized membrane protein (UPF0127 family)